jgi:hypothetical protein
MYKTPPQRRRKKNDIEEEEGILREELNHRHLAKDIHNNQVNSVSIESLFPFCAVSRKFLSECDLHAFSTEQIQNSYATVNMCLANIRDNVYTYFHAIFGGILKYFCFSVTFSL